MAPYPGFNGSYDQFCLCVNASGRMCECVLLLYPCHRWIDFLKVVVVVCKLVLKKRGKKRKRMQRNFSVYVRLYRKAPALIVGWCCILTAHGFLYVCPSLAVFPRRRLQLVNSLSFSLSLCLMLHAKINEIHGADRPILNNDNSLSLSLPPLQ